MHTTPDDPEVKAFEDAVLRSLDQAQQGQIAAVHTPSEIARRRAGRPVGSTKAAAKQATTIRFDADVLAALKATGKGWQTRVNDAMREWVKAHPNRP